MNVTYRRALQTQFGVHLDDERVQQLRNVLDLLTPIEDVEVWSNDD